MVYKFKREFAIFVLTGIITLTLCFKVITTPSVLAENDKSNSFSVIMYHHISEDESRVGDYVITPSQLKSDFEYLKNNGYKTLSVRELIAIDRGEMKLTEKSVVITFDDGQESFYKYAYPLLVEYNFKAVFSVIGKYTEEFSKTEDHNVKYSHVTYKEIGEMVSSGLVEIGNHSYNLHKSFGAGRNGVERNKDETLIDYEKALTSDINRFNENFLEELGFTPQIYTYPFGRFSKDTENIIKKLGFAVGFTCYEKKNTVKINDNWLFRLGRYNRSGKYATEKFFKKVFY